MEDWNQKFSELVQRGAGEPGDIAPAAREPAVESDAPVSDSNADQAMAERRVSIAATWVHRSRLREAGQPCGPGAKRAPPPDAEPSLYLTCRGFSSNAPYPFAETTGIFPNVGSFRMNPASRGSAADGTSRRARDVHAGRAELDRIASAERPPGRRHPVLGSVSRHRRATVRHRRKGVVEVWVEDGPELSFRVTPEATDALQAHVEKQHNRSNRRCRAQPAPRHPPPFKPRVWRRKRVQRHCPTLPVR